MHKKHKPYTRHDIPEFSTGQKIKYAPLAFALIAMSFVVGAYRTIRNRRRG